MVLALARRGICTWSPSGRQWPIWFVAKAYPSTTIMNCEDGYPRSNAGFGDSEAPGKRWARPKIEVHTGSSGQPLRTIWMP